VVSVKVSGNIRREKMDKKTWLSVLLMFALALGQVNIASAAGPEKIMLGNLSAFTGGSSIYGEDTKRAMTLAIEEINAQGGFDVAGKKYTFEVIHMDHKFQAALAVSGYRRLVDLNGVRFIQQMGSMTGEAIMKYNEKDNVLVDNVTPADGLTTSGNKLALNQCTRSNGNDPPVVEAAWKRGLKTMYILADDSEFGRDHAEMIEQTYRKMGGKVLGIEFVQATKSVDFMPVLTKIKGYKTDCIYIVAVEEPAARIAKQAREAGITAKLLFTEHFKQKAIDIVGIEKLDGTLFTGSALALISLTPIGTPPEFLRYREKYMKRWPGAYLSATGLYGYNLLYYLAKAMQISGTTTDVNKIRAACSDALRETSNVVTYTGFTPGGRGYGSPIFVLGIEKGKVRIISSSPYPKDLAAAGEK
jgi:branched-chain amino acid transport system substrate-binding protein